jgi:uncharacterized membrane protein
VVLFIEKNETVRWNAVQSLILGGVGFVASFVPFLGWLVAFGVLIAQIVLAFKVYGGQNVRVPVVADFADKLLTKVGANGDKKENV